MAGSQKLFCHEAGVRDRKGSILFIHGAIGSWRNFDLIVPYLEKDYHLLLPDLPHHGKSQDVRPFSIPLATQLLADEIRERAEHGRAHIIGFSLGMHVALDLITKHPELVNDVFMSGYNRLPPSKYIAHGFWLSEKVEGLLPRSVVRWLMDGADFSDDSATPCTLELCKEIMAPLTPGSEQEWPEPWPAKTLLMCAGKAGIVPSADNADATVKLRDIARKLNPQTVAYTHPLMRHPWLRQDPQLFAQMARMWFEESKVPEGFVEL